MASILTAAACQDFKQEVLSGSVPLALKKLEALKEALLDCDSLPPIALARPNAEMETELAKEILEYAIILSIKAGDKSSFQRYMASLRPYYTAARSTTPAGTNTSDIVYTILGLNLLYLLVENRLADFHCEVRLIMSGYPDIGNQDLRKKTNDLENHHFCFNSCVCVSIAAGVTHGAAAISPGNCLLYAVG